MRSYQTQSYEASGKVGRDLRPEVAAVVAAHVRMFPGTGGVDGWRAYGAFKAALSRACGWDAGPRYDQAQYDMGIAAYVEEVGL